MGNAALRCGILYGGYTGPLSTFATLETKKGDSKSSQEHVLHRKKIAMQATGVHILLEEAPMGRSTVGFTVILTLSMLGVPLTANAQAPTHMHRIGVLWFGPGPAAGALFETFQQGLRDLGYTEGQNLAFEHRYGEGRYERLLDLAAELVELNVDIILATGTPAAQAAQRATTKIPIVFMVVADPVEARLVESLTRPGANLTGLTILAPEQSRKRLELLTEAVPGISRVAVLWNPADRYAALEVRVLEATVRALGVQLQSLEVRNPGEFERAFEAAARDGVGALSILATPFIARNLGRIVNLALEYRLPAIFWARRFTEAGGLMAYGPNQQDLMRRAAALVGKILKGAKPADLPVEQAMRFELVINLKTAQALGLTIPPTLLFQADEVIR